MKSKLLTIAICGVVALLFGVTSCKVNNDQTKEIARNAGLFSATTWIAVDNPNSNVLTAVTNVMIVVKEKASEVQSGQTYVEVLYPELVKIIDANVEKQYRPLCKAGTITLLGQLDLLFSTHPEWEGNQDKFIDVSNAFIDGAIQGLNMSESNSFMKQLKLNYSRSKIASKLVIK